MIAIHMKRLGQGLARQEAYRRRNKVYVLTANSPGYSIGIIHAICISANRN